MGRRTLAAGGISSGSAAVRGTPTASRAGGSRGSSNRQSLQAAVLETPAVSVADSCWPRLGGNMFAALAADEADDEIEGVLDPIVAEPVGCASGDKTTTLAGLLEDLAGTDAYAWTSDSLRFMLRASTLAQIEKFGFGGGR